MSGGVASIGFSANMAVVKTRSGYARGIAGDIDRCGFESVLGTIAGDDTIFLVIREGYTKNDVLLELESVIPEFKTKILL
jgi:transcriptional regulator of arginine metabolism